MFDRRLKTLLIVFVAAAFLVTLRLAQLQIVQADYYRAQAERSLIQRPVFLPFVRGRILDRAGEVLVRDEPCWDVTIHFDILALDAAGEPKRMNRAVRRWLKDITDSDKLDAAAATAALRGRIEDMWREMALFTADRNPVSIPELRDRARAVYERVMRIRQVVAQRRGFDAPVAEETTTHAILTDLDAEQQIAARELFAPYPWVQVDPSSRRRTVGDSTPFAHLLGRTGKVDADDVAGDPNPDDPFARYQANDRIGISGVEFAGESILRGRRGQVVMDRNGSVLTGEYIPARAGSDLRLTIHGGLQRRLYTLLSATVAEVPASAGGSIVVLDVARREVLALVSYPSYDLNQLDELYPQLRDDTDRLPLRFRAMANMYPPGSTVKPLVALAGFMSGQLDLDTREHCTGFLLPEARDRWRCWEVHGTDIRMAHGWVEVVRALSGSCNIFMYRLGERIGVDRLCSAFDMVGIGRSSGTGLREEAVGINPTPEWLMRVKSSPVYPAHARNFSIGQGELSMTPVQVANLMATYANGRYRPVTLIHGEEPTPEWQLPVASEQWSAIRRGIYGVVNDPNGTAYKYAHYSHPRYALCGKTGSATAHRWPTTYAITYRDTESATNVALVRAGAELPAIERFRRENPDVSPEQLTAEPVAWWPPHPPMDGERYAHAWFGAFLQELDANGRPDWSKEPRVAFAALVEFGGSGGRTSGPLARKIAAELISVFGPDLNIDCARAGERSH